MSVRALACVAFTALALLASPGRARADALPSLPESGFSAGPSVAWVSGAQHTPGGLMLGLDLALFVDHVWLSAGTRLRVESDAVGAVYPYVELGGWYLVNFGAGYTLGVASGRAVWHNVHLFLGVPIPLGTSGPILPYVEPYYRPMLGDGVVVHEVGVLVKGALVGYEDDERDRRR